ncbi:hypothetical protein SDC9_62070 [bioreactor metagenome]|uniref:Outer membrane protein beta-barrel domain-containing protein n=1 Tax=bioreactor metagenome TaxID=1076179 RepID=A0A644XHZ2_9ZZZZ
MKKQILIILLVLPVLSIAQKLSISPFYNINCGVLPTTWNSTNDHTIVTIDTSITKYSGEAKNISLGAGKRVGVNIEYKKWNLVSAGASLSYFSSSDKPINSISEAEYDPYTIYNLEIATSDIYRNKSLDFGLYTHFLLYDKNSTPYFNAGIVLSYSNYTLNREVNIRNNLPGYYPTEKYVFDYKISPSLHYGLTGSAGIEINRNKTISMFAETYAILMNVSPTKRKCTSAIWNSDDYMGNMTTSEKETDYVDSVAETDNQNDNEPSKLLKYNQSFCSIGIKAGLKINF